jgi:ectoine hydroxylase-related dioxygenase (phytanoyl-CoA dioxygenase family)
VDLTPQGGQFGAAREGFRLPTPSKHPLSADFRWENHTGPLRRVTEAERAAFDELGFIKIEGAFTAAEIAEVTAAIDPLEAVGEERLRAAGGTISIATADEITFTTHLVKASPTLRAFAAHPFIKDVCHDLLGPSVRLYWDQSVYKKTAQMREFPWHQDNGYTFIEPQQYLTFWLPLVDVDEQNGCPWIAPGLHRGGTLDHWVTEIGLKCLDDAPDAVAVPAKAGDAIVFSSLAPHRTGPNLKTGTVRKAYILQYSHDGSVATYRDGRTAVQDDPERQFVVLRPGD